MKLLAKTSERGSMLLESIIALAVLTTTLLGLYAVLVTSHSKSMANKDKQRIVADVHALMEQMSTVPLPDLRSTFEDGVDIVAFSDRQVRDESIRVVYETPDGQLPIVYRVEANWSTSHGQPGQLKIKGVRSR